MVMTPNSDSFYDDSCSLSGQSAPSLTSPAPSTSTTHPESPVFFTDEEMAQIENLDLVSMMSPIIKGTLKETIQKRLVENGKPVPEIQLRTTSTEQLTEEEEEKRLIRRQRNKMAAQKCRSRKKERGDQLEQEAEVLEGRRDSLQEEVGRLRKELEVLQDMLDAHEPFCKKRRRCTQDAIQMCLSNDHTYTQLLGCDDQPETVPSWSDVEVD